MRNGFVQTLLSLLLAAIILAGGWLGIRSLDLVLPSGTDGQQLHDMAALNEESFQALLPPEPLPPFTYDGFPAQAQPVDSDSDEYKLYYLLFANLDEMSISIVQSTLYSLDLVEEGFDPPQQLATYTDERGRWVLWQTEFSTGSGNYRVQIALHSRDGLRLVQVVSDLGTGTRLSPDQALLDRAADACQEFLVYWMEYAQDLGYADLETSSLYSNEAASFFSNDKGELFSLQVHLPLSPATPLKTELAGSQCRLYYPAEGGQVIMIYDFIGMRITGMAYIPDA